MVRPTTFNSMSTSYTNKYGDNRAKWSIKTYTFTPKLVDSSLPQYSGVTLPPNSFVVRALIRVFTPESTGSSKIFSVSRSSGGAILSGINVDSVGVSGEIFGSTALGWSPDPNGAPDDIEYVLDSADFAELDCEVSLEVYLVD